jgi:hypothetical protein
MCSRETSFTPCGSLGKLNTCKDSTGIVPFGKLQGREEYLLSNLEVNEMRFNNLNLMPFISSKYKRPPCIEFGKSVPRTPGI